MQLSINCAFLLLILFNFTACINLENKEENDLFSLSFDLLPENESKWQEVVNADAHFMGFVKNK